MKPLFIFIAIIFSLTLSFRGIEEYKYYKFRAHWSEYQEKGATGEQLKKSAPITLIMVSSFI